MKRLLLVLTGVMLCVSLMGGPSCAEEKALIYKTFKEKSGKVLNKSSVTIADNPSGQKVYKRTTESPNHTEEEEFILDDSYITQSWQATDLAEDTIYAGEKRGNELLLAGKLKGKEFNKTIELDNRPFYYTPKFNLTRFVLSKAKQVKFWMLRKDELTKYLMQAKKEGEGMIMVNGKEINVIKVYYSATGIGERYYKRMYYFRKSDGLFVKKEGPKDELMELISEE